MSVKAQGSITVAVLTAVSSSTRYYLLQSSTLSVPSKPTANPPSGWTTTEPTYTEGSTNSLYTCDLTVFSDDTWSYSDVSLSSSYEAAKAAYNKAVAAQAAATAAQTFIGTCSTDAATAAKTVTGVTGFALAAGVCIAVTFSNANTAPSPTLNVNAKGAKPIMLNGAAYAYWVAGATVQFIYDGTSWQVCNVPLYGATATIGNPASKNIYIDADSIDFRQIANVIGSLGIEPYADTHNLLSLLCGANYDGVKVGGGAYAILDQRVADATYGRYGSSVTGGMHEEDAPRIALKAYRGDGSAAHPVDKAAEIAAGIDAGGTSYIEMNADRITIGSIIGTGSANFPADWTVGAFKLIRRGNEVCCRIDATYKTATTLDYDLFTIPSAFRPTAEVTAPGVWATGTVYPAFVKIESSGSIHVISNGAGQRLSVVAFWTID